MATSVKRNTKKQQYGKVQFHLKSILAIATIVSSCLGNHGVSALRSGDSSNQQGGYHQGSGQTGGRNDQLQMENWIIVNMGKPNTILYPGAQFLSFLDTMKEWRAILVGDVGDLDHGCKTCIVLSKSNSDGDDDGTISLLQKAIFSAINGGANYIYMMTSLHDVKKTLDRMTSPDNRRGVVYSGRSIFNPCTHFVQPLFGTNRSFGKCYDRNWMYSYTTEDFPPIDVISSCDGCDKISNAFPGGRIHCDASTPNLMVKAGSFVKSTFRNSLWSKNSFWALFFYLLTEDTPLGNRESSNEPKTRLETTSIFSTVQKELMSSYVTQRLMWESGGSIEFIRSHDLLLSSQNSSYGHVHNRGNNYKAGGNRNSTSFVKGTDESSDKSDGEVYSEGKTTFFRNEEMNDQNKVLDNFCVELDNENIQLKQLTQYLKGWACKEDNGVIDCVRELCKELATAKVLTMKEMELIENFLSDISTAFYVPPQRSVIDKHPLSAYTEAKVNGVYFWPSSLYRMWTEHPFKSICSKVDEEFGVVNDTSSLMANRIIGNVDETNGRRDGKFNQKGFLSRQHFGAPTELNHTAMEGKMNQQGFYSGVNYFKPAPIYNIVLVIVFKINDAATQIQMTQYFDFIYGRYFKHIIYCSSGAQMVKLFAKMYPQPMNYIDLKTTNANIFPYLCVSEAMKLYQDVKGYLQLDSDTLLNPWSFSKMVDNLDNPWLPSYSYNAKLSQTEVMASNRAPIRWRVWNDVSSGRSAFLRMLKELTSMTQTIQDNFKILHLDGSKPELDMKSGNITRILKQDKLGIWTKEKLGYLFRFNYVVKHFFERLGAEVPKDATVYYGSTAIFYVPTKYRETFTLFSDEFYRFNVHADIAVHTMLMSMATLNDVIHLNGTVAMVSHTSVLLRSYSEDHVYLFPWQLYMMRSKDRSKFMCNVYLPKLDSGLINFNAN